MKKFNKIAGVFFISLIIMLVIYIATIILEYIDYTDDLNNTDDDYYNTKQFTEEDIQNIANILKSYYEGNYKADYEQLAINCIASNNFIYFVDINSLKDQMAQEMKKNIEANQNGDYYALAKQKIESHYDDLEQMRKDEVAQLKKEAYQDLITKIGQLCSIGIVAIELAVLLYCILYSEYDSWKSFLIASLKIVIFILIIANVSFILSELEMMLINGDTFLEHWNTNIKPNVSNINYWKYYYINPLSLVLYYLIFAIGSLIKVYIVSKVRKKEKTN